MRIAHTSLEYYVLQGTLFNFLVIGGLLISIDSLGFMGELPAIPIEDHHVR